MMTAMALCRARGALFARGRAAVQAAGFCSSRGLGPELGQAQAWIDRHESLESMPGRERFKERSMRREELAMPSANPEDREILDKLKNFGNTRNWQEAYALYKTLEEPSIHVHVTMLRALTRSFQEAMAWQVFNQIPEKSLPAYNLMLAMLSKVRKMREVEGLVADLKQSGLEMNVFTYSALIGAYGQVGDIPRAMSILDEMDQKGLRLTEVEYGTALGACGRNGDTHAALEVMAKMEKNGMVPHIGHMTSLILSYSRSRDMAGARAAFDKIKAMGLRPDVVAYTALIGVISGPDAFAQARAIQEEMAKEGVAPHVFFYSNLLQAAIESADDEGFQKVLQEMQQRGIQRNNKIEQRIHEYEREKARREAHRQQQQEAQEMQAAPAAETPLPAGWAFATDPNTGRSYYWKEDDPNNSVTWERPL